MPSGLSHIMLLQQLSFSENLDLKMLLFSANESFQTGAVGPDLPYASIADNNLLKTHSKFANYFHYDITNQIPLRAFEKIRTLSDGEQKRSLFAFFLGYTSHIIADGIIHPFVRDKVGNYDGHETEHRTLELALDVLLYESISGNSDIDSINTSEIEYIFINFDSSPNSINILELFSELISAIYGETVSVKDIQGWVKGIYRLFDFATGNWPLWISKTPIINTLANLPPKSILEEKEKYNTLNKPIDCDVNFLKKESVSFIDDCIPKFNEIMHSFAEKAYSYTFGQGVLTEEDLPYINLDSGIPGDETFCHQTPVLWRI